MKSLARYATTNAVTRTMLSELLAGRDYEDLLRSESVDGAWLAASNRRVGTATQRSAAVGGARV